MAICLLLDLIRDAQSFLKYSLLSYLKGLTKIPQVFFYIRKTSIIFIVLGSKNYCFVMQ